MHIYLSRWETYLDAGQLSFRPVLWENGWIGGLRDLRVNSSRLPGYCLLVKNSLVTPPANSVYLGNDFDVIPLASNIVLFEIAMGILPGTFSGKTVRECIIDLAFNIENNASFNYTPRPRKDGRTRLIIGGEVLYDEQTHSPQKASVQITESWNCTPNANIDVGCDLAWVNTVSNGWERDSGIANNTGNSTHATANSMLDTSNNESQINIITLARINSFIQVGSVCRSPLPVAADANTADGYFIQISYEGTPQVVYKLRKVENGVRSDLTSPVNITLSLPEIWKTKADGNEISAFRDGVSLFTPVEDNSILTGQYTGIYGSKSGADANGTIQIGQFTASDIGFGINNKKRSRVNLVTGVSL